MALESPVVILFDSLGNAMAVQNGVVIPASTPALLASGADGGGIARYLLVDSLGRPVVVGPGTAGTPAGGVLSVQGVVGGVGIPLSDPAEGATGAAAPAQAIQVAGTDGTNIQVPHVFDGDTGVGTEWDLGMQIRLPGSGGSVVGGTAANPIRTDPTGTTTQPISAASLPLPTNAATETTLAGRLADSTFTARINTLGQKVMAASTPVVIASDQSPLPTLPNFSSTGTTSSVASAAGNVMLLAANAGRKGAAIFNDSNKFLYLKLGATASVTDFTALLRQGDYYEVPFDFQGQIDGIWSAANGFARITELT